jgi:type II secretory pathway component PulF
VSSEPRSAADGGDLALFHRVLAELCRSGVPLSRAFGVLRAEFGRGPLRRAIDEMERETSEGVPLAEAYARRRDRFPVLYRALVEAGTAAGDLPGVLEEISRHAARRAEVSRRIRQALAHPLVTAVFVLLVGAGAVLYLTPTTWSLTETVSGSSPLPWALGSLGLVAVFLVGAFVLTWLRSPLAGEGGLRIPVIGPLRLEAARSHTASTLALLLRREIPLPAALDLTAATIESRSVATRVRAMAERARAGAGLAEAVGDAVFEPSVAWLIESAEGGPTVVDALEDVADLYRGRLERRLDRTTVLVRPIAEVVVGVAVFGFVFSFLGPLFDYMDILAGG